MTIFGWDASDYDWDRGPMDYRAAKLDGIEFTTHKATEGTTTVHAHLAHALNRARMAGIPVLGAYHVVRSCSVSAQIAHFLGILDEKVPWWRTHQAFMLQVDLELWEYDRVSANIGRQFIHELRQVVPDTFITLYASKGQYGDALHSIDVPLWNANYGDNPWLEYKRAYPGDRSNRWNTYSGKTPMFLQYGSRTIIGTQQSCDANAFRGTVDQLIEMVSGRMDDDNVKSLLLLDGTAPVFLTDGVTARWVRSEAEIDDLRTLHGEGTYKLGYSGKVRVVTRRELIGTINGAIPAGFEDLAAQSLQLSTEQVTSIVRSISDAVASITGITQQDVVTAVKQALREGIS